LRKQGFARARGADQKNVAFGQLNLVLGAAHVLEPFVVVVNRDRQNSFGRFLADHVVVEAGFDFARERQIGFGGFRVGRVRRHFITNDVVAQLYALVANEDRWSCDEFFHLVLAFAAKGAIENFFARRAFFVGHKKTLRKK
jgi:hypothetical protein